MKQRMARWSCMFLLLLVTAFRSEASHIYGADLFYTHLTGTTYTINMVVYADCAGSAFSTLSSASPQISVFNNFSLLKNMNLVIQAPTAGQEVTPVCPSQLNNTNCASPFGTVPGVVKFTYSGNVDLLTTAANWRFVFTGSLGATTLAGRSNTISNIFFPPPGGSSVMMLEATLNNLTANNSSPIFTTIPTPFFCVNKSGTYNPGAVDPNSDSLAYLLVDGMDDATGIVSYRPGFSATSPLASVAGSYNFSSTTGQMNFTPSAAQRSLVVNRMEEYRNGVLIGTSMREMTFVVLNNCNNNAPIDSVSNTTGGTSVGSNTITVCRSAGTVGFSISPTDPDGDTVNVQFSGLPAGASFTITNNNTMAPTGSFSWNVSAVTPGAYNIFVTYTDNGCPLSSKQTLAYTVIVLPDPAISFNIISPITCTKKAVYTITQATSGLWKYKRIKNGVAIDSTAFANGIKTDSLSAGTYVLHMQNSSGCSRDTTIIIADPSTTQVAISLHRPTCNAFTDGQITLQGFNAIGPYKYAIGAAAFTSTRVFSNLPGNIYALHVVDAEGCKKDTIIVLDDSLKVSTAYNITPVVCNGDANGAISISASAGHGAPFTYKMNSNPAGSVTNFANLAGGNYTFSVKDSKGCFNDTIINLKNPPLLVPANNVVQVNCHGYATGIINETPAGGVVPYTYSMDNITFTGNASFTNLKAGTYTVFVKDSNGCIRSEPVSVTEPPAIDVLFLSGWHPLCTGGSDGRFVVKASGGIAPYTFSVDGRDFTISDTMTGLANGPHVIHIKDANGCIRDTTMPLVDPPVITRKYSMAMPVCNTLHTGIITAAGAGGVPPYRYSVNNGATNSKGNFTGLAQGAYLVRIMDNNGCISDTSITLFDSLTVIGNISSKDPSCFGSADGEIYLSPSGGVAPYIASAGDRAYVQSNTLKGYGFGNYSLRVKDSLGCMLDTTVSLVQPARLIIEKRVVPNNCYSSSLNGSIAIAAVGGTKPYSYKWSNNAPATDSAISKLANGRYYVWVTDANGCKDSAGAEVIYGDCCNPVLPTAFTPNGDGSNDVFRILTKGEMKLVGFSIYNRYGQQVFFTDDIKKGWDGTMNGNRLDLGTYFYYIKATCGYNAEYPVEMKGDVILIR